MSETVESPSLSSHPVDQYQSAPCPAVSAPRKPVRLQERRGSNVSLVLDVSSLNLGAVEPLCSISTPKETILHLLRTSTRPLTPSQLQKASEETSRLNSEYQKIPPNFVNPAELDIPGHALKDRYKTILPNPVTRVCLRNPAAEEGGDSEIYINANYVKGFNGAPSTYIATQGPMLNTVHDFWEMVWQEGSTTIVMITKLKERNEKCELYWPEKEGSYGRFELRVSIVKECDGYTVRDMVIQVGSESRLVRHYWYSSWPDHQTPDCTGPLLRLVVDVEEHRLSLPNPGPTIVHCSAGIGRTGCFIASSIGCLQLQHTRKADVLGIVCKLRLDRGGMIQTSEQYQFLYLTLAHYSRQLGDTDSSSESPIPVQTSSTTESPIPAQTSSTTDSPIPVQTSSTTDSPIPVQTSSTTESPIPVQTSSTTESPIPVQTSSTTDSPIPVQTSSTTDSPIPVQTSSVTETGDDRKSPAKT